MTNRITDKAIREYLGHNGSECRVLIRRNGDVLRHGDAEHNNRGADFWAYIGSRNEIADQMAWEASAGLTISKLRW